jgi:hypothetical protein
MSRERGFLQLRRGIFQHVRDGCLTPVRALCLIYMLTQADTRTGVWSGSAGALARELSIPQWVARRVLESLSGRYIKRFPVPGRHKCYPVLLHKFLVTDGEHKGQQLNALESESPTNLRYFASEHVDEHDAQHVTTQKKLETGEKKKRQNLAAKPAPPADPRYKPFYDFAYEAFRAKNGQEPSWDVKDGANLKRFLDKQPRVTLEEFQRRFGNFLRSTEHFTLSHGDSLAYFVTAFDRFLNGPLIDSSTGGFNGSRSKNSAAVHPEPGKYDAATVQQLSNVAGLPPV